nr:hypothetical protein [Mucilaginibacter oryzae]
MENGFPVSTVMKLDTEGAELGVLKGLVKKLANLALKKILFEAGPDLTDEPPTNGIAILLKQHGFDKISILTRNEIPITPCIIL